MLESSPFGRLADVMLRQGGLALVFMEIDCAFDESGTHEASPLLCMAGYAMEKSQARELEREWDEVLNWEDLEHPLPYFHMSDCAPGSGVYAGISKPHRAMVVSRMIGIIKRRAMCGFAATLDKAEYNQILAGHPLYPDPYMVVAHVVMKGVSGWINNHVEGTKSVAYFFETGHRARPTTDAMINLLVRTPRIQKEYQYAGHGFLPKLGNPIVQAADLLAWQWAKDRKSLVEGRSRRADFNSLISHPHRVVHIEADMLTKLAEGKQLALQYLSGPIYRQGALAGQSS